MREQTQCTGRQGVWYIINMLTPVTLSHSNQQRMTMWTEQTMTSFVSLWMQTTHTCSMHAIHADVMPNSCFWCFEQQSKHIIKPACFETEHKRNKRHKLGRVKTTAKYLMQEPHLFPVIRFTAQRRKQNPQCDPLTSQEYGQSKLKMTLHLADGSKCIHQVQCRQRTSDDLPASWDNMLHIRTCNTSNEQTTRMQS